MTTTMRVGRRHFLIGAAGVTGAAAAAPFAAQAQQSGLPAFVSWKDPEAMIVHSDLTLETERGAIGTSIITPNDEFYIRNNLPSPSEDQVGERDSWQVAFAGLGDARTMTLGELKTVGVETIATVLQCSGNGRAFFDHETRGSQWSVGAAGCALWTGVPVRDLVEAMGGIADGMNFMTSLGAETIPEGLDVQETQIERSVPAEARETAILAWEMNGEPIPLANGGPVRMVVPGFYGCNNVKYVKRVAFTEDESSSHIQQSSYRVRPVGVDPDPSQPTMWQMNVKSWLTGPLVDAESGRVAIHGVAFGGTDAVDGVEVSTDGGETWQAARFLGPDLGRFAWRPFVLMADLSSGTHTLASRATDAEGNTQPETFEPNQRGYGHNGWRAHAVELTIS